MKTLLSLALAAVSLLSGLSGCAVYTPSGAIVVDPVEVPAGRGGFCPPGQAKKGRC